MQPVRFLFSDLQDAQHAGDGTQQNDDDESGRHKAYADPVQPFETEAG